MKPSTFALALVVGVFSLGGQAQSEPVRFQGSFEIVESFGQCPKYDPVGEHGLARFRPQLPGTNNGPGASFIWFGDRDAKGYRLARGNFSSQLKLAQTIYVEDEWGPDDLSNPSVRFLQIVTVPNGGISLSTKTLSIVGEVQEFDFMPNCSIRFQMRLSRFIDLVAGGSVSRGEQVANTCLPCHSFDQGGPNKIGPPLFGIVNRRVAAVSTFPYSTAMVAFARGGRRWTYDELDMFFEDPDSRVSGNKMAFPDMEDEQERADLVAYMRTLAVNPPPLY